VEVPAAAGPPALREEDGEADSRGSRTPSRASGRGPGAGKISSDRVFGGRDPARAWWG